MMVSTRGRYALRLLLDIAEYQDADGFVPLKDAADRQEISKKYAEQIVNIPGVSLILESKGGKNGGYRLSKSPSECTVGEIIHAAEGSLSPVSCIADGSVTCDRRATCAVMSVWQGLDDVINEYLDGITLQDLLDKKASFDGGNDYVI